jgi:hypothetical protein
LSACVYIRKQSTFLSTRRLWDYNYCNNIRPLNELTLAAVTDVHCGLLQQLHNNNVAYIVPGHIYSLYHATRSRPQPYIQRTPAGSAHGKLTHAAAVFKLHSVSIVSHVARSCCCCCCCHCLPAYPVLCCLLLCSAARRLGRSALSECLHRQEPAHGVVPIV